MDQPKYRIEIFWSDEDGGYIANVPDLRYCSAFGETYEEALREVLVAMELHLDTLRELGREFPEPKAGGMIGISVSDPATVHGEGNVVSAAEGVGHAISTQESALRLSREFFENWIETLEDHAELNRRTMQDVADLVREQREYLRKMAELETPERLEEKQPNATVAARRKAAEMGIDLTQVEGTGSGGLITARDVARVTHE